MNLSKVFDYASRNDLTVMGLKEYVSNSKKLQNNNTIISVFGDMSSIQGDLKTALLAYPTRITFKMVDCIGNTLSVDFSAEEVR